MFLPMWVLFVFMACGCNGSTRITEAEMKDAEKSRQILFSNFVKQSDGAAKFVRLFPDSHYFVKFEDKESDLYEISITSYFGGRFKITIIQPGIDSGADDLQTKEDYRVRIEELLKVVPLAAERFKLKHGMSWDLDPTQWREVTTLKGLMELMDVNEQKPVENFEFYRNHMLSIYSEFKVPRD